jgi:hypothetical protein
MNMPNPSSEGNEIVEGEIPVGSAEETHEVEGASEVHETTPPVEGEQAPTEESPAVDPRDEKIAALEAKFEEMRLAQEAKGEEKPPVPASEAPKEMTPQQWEEAEKGWGFARSKNPDTGEESLSIDPKKLLMRISASMDAVVARANEYTDKLVHGNVSDIRFDSVLGGMEKKSGFTDIRQYSEAVKQYLKERYNPKDHSNPRFIEDGYFWAKGKNMKNAVKKAAAGMERNKTIVKPAGAGAPPAAKGGKLTVASMNQEQRHLAEQTFRDMPKEKAWAEYCKLY